MKKTNLFAVILMTSLFAIVMGCDNNDSIINEESYVVDDSSNGVKRSYADALAIAQGSLSMLDEPTTRSGEKRSIDESDTHYILTPKTRTTGGDSDTLLYVFNFADNGGYAVVSANAATTGLLAITEEGNYNEVTLEKNKGLAMFMDMAKEYSRFQGPILPLIDTFTILISHVNPLVQVRWGQEFPEGLYFPNTVAGCNNTATALVASYLEYPTQLQLTFDHADTTEITLNWSAIKQHFSGSSSYTDHSNSSCWASVEAHKNVGRLVRQIARYNCSQFTYHDTVMHWYEPLPYTYTTYVADTHIKTSTNTYADHIHWAFDSLGYSYTGSQSYSTQCTKNHLDNNRLIYMIGKSNIPLFQEPVEHAWVIDGYKYYKYVITDFRFTEPVIQTVYKYYNHINWGWNGNSNGYFYDGVFNTQNAYMYDNVPHTATFSFYDLEWCSVYR